MPRSHSAPVLPLVLLAAYLSPALPDAAAEQPGAIRVLILSGRNNHDWRATTPFLRKILLDSGRFDVRVNEEPAGLTGETLAAYNVLVLDYNGPRWGKVAEQAVEEFVRSGKGMVAIHAASYAFGGLEVLGDRHVRTGIHEPPWPEYARMIGAAWSEEEPKSGHGRKDCFRVKPADSQHPITKGLPEGFLVCDELYHNLRVRPGIHVLATAYDEPKLGGTGKDEPVLWTVAYEKGRVFHTVLGHDPAAIQEPGFVATLLRGTEWAATGAVSLPASFALDAPNKDAVRVMVVTGGHDYEPSFETVFEGPREIRAMVNPHPIAFRSDLRRRYDVLVLYDTVQELEESQRKNLRDFLESGKGLVVLHHAIASFNSWPWWYQEVVGGRYLLNPDGSTPASTFKHDVELGVRPVLRHPITRGIEPFHIWDETYKGIWISPKVQVLLQTDNPASDGPVAWISPYEKSRVVYIQLGHGRSAHVHPAFRVLVRNAILWAAGKVR